MATLLTAGRGILLDLAGDGALREPAAGWAGRIDLVEAACPEHPDLRAMLLRPDGHTAWLRTAGEHDTDGLTEALQHWYGPAARSAGRPGAQPTKMQKG